MKTYEQAIERAAEYYFNGGGTDEMSRIFSFQYSTAVCMVSHIYEVPTAQVEQDIVKVVKAWK